MRIKTMANQKVFCIIDSDHVYHDVSNTLRGAQIKATKDGWQSVGVRWVNSGQLVRLCDKHQSKWVFTQYGNDLKQRGII